MKITQYYLDLEVIKKIMDEKNLNACLLTEGTDMSEKRLTRYLNGTVYKRVPYDIAMLLRTKLDTKIEDFVTTVPPHCK